MYQALAKQWEYEGYNFLTLQCELASSDVFPMNEHFDGNACCLLRTGRALCRTVP